jgi:glutathione synthase/RimK-type ligase-like ATP-grasp enzyme
MLNGKKRIAFATHGDLPGLSKDDRLAVAELVRLGAEVEAAVWDDPGVQWDGYDCVVIRSCWDYHLRAGEFLDWLGRLERDGISLWNPASVVRTNVDKGYLVDLAEAGFPVVPTVRLDPGKPADLERLLAERGWDEAVVKPAVSASAFRTRRLRREDAAAAQAELEEMLGRSGVLVQRFLSEIQTGGEWSILFFGGEYSHAVRKRPKAGDFRVQEELGGCSIPEHPAPSIVEQARAIAGTIPAPWLYARVDGVEIDGVFTLMELELTEPLLFLGWDPQAPARFARAVLAASALPIAPVIC